MAAYVWTAAIAGNWSVGSNWSVGGVAQSVPPTAADDVTIGAGTGATNSNCTLNATSVCRSIDVTGYTGTFTHGAFTLSIGDGTAGVGNVALKFPTTGWTYTLTNAKTSAISFVSTSATQQTITTGGKTLGNVVINGAGNSYKLTDNMTTSGSFTYTAGTTIDTATNSAIITLNGAAVTFTGGSKTYFQVDMTGSGAAVAAGANTYTNFSRVGTNALTDSLQLNNNMTFTGTLTLAGNTIQGSNRLIVQSSALGTARLLTVTSATIAITGDVDFIDISLNSSGTTWTNASSAFVGDCGGNAALITTNATVAATQTNTGATGNWSDATKWTSRAPLPQDGVVLNTGVGSVTMNMPRMGKSIDFTGFTGTVLLNSLNFQVFGGIIFDPSMTVTIASAIQMTLAGRSAFNITSNTKGSPPTTITASGATYTFTDNWKTSASSATALQLTLGTLTVVGSVTLSSNTSGTRFTMSGGTLNMGNNTWDVSGNGGGINWQVTGGTLNPNSSTITFSAATATGRTFAGGGKTYNNLSLTGGGAGAVTITGANTFATLPQITGGTLSIIWPGSTTNTFTTGGNFGNSSNVITMTASAGSATLSFGSQVNADFLNLTNIIAAGTTPAYAGANSTDGGGNTNWTFTAAPSTGQVGTYKTLTGVGI